MVIVVEVGMVEGLLNWNMEFTVGVKLVLEVGGVSKRKDCEVEVVVLVMLFRVLVILFILKLNVGFGVEFADVLVVVIEVIVEAVLVWLMNRGAFVVVVGVVV